MLNIDTHVFSSSSGNSGKSTMLLSTLSYYLTKLQPDLILILDIGDNPDVYNWLLEYSKTDSTLDNEVHKYDIHSQVSRIHAFRPARNLNFDWRFIETLIQTCAQLANSETDTDTIEKVLLLIDTGDSPRKIFNNTDPMIPKLEYTWRFFVWICWMPNVLHPQHLFAKETEDTLNELIGASEESTVNCSLIPIHVFNPVIQFTDSEANNRVDSEDDEPKSISALINDRINRFRSGRYIPPEIKISSLGKYGTLPLNGLISIDKFFSELYMTFLKENLLGLSMPTKDAFELVGKALNNYFVSKDPACRNGKCRYSNIFGIHIYDQELAKLKNTGSNRFRGVSRSSAERLHIENLKEFLGEVGRAVAYHLDAIVNEG